MFYLVGVDHSVQTQVTGFTDTPAQEEFRACLECAIQEYKPELIGEEFSDDALRVVRKFSKQPVELLTKKIAEAAGVRHRLCDTDLATKARLGYQGQDGWGLLLEALPDSIEHSELQCLKFALEIYKDFPLREQHWLNRLKDSFCKEVIFVCGDGHIETFGRRLTEQGVSTTIVKREIGVPTGLSTLMRGAMEYLKNRKELIDKFYSKILQCNGAQIPKRDYPTL